MHFWYWPEPGKRMKKTSFMHSMTAVTYGRGSHLCPSQGNASFYDKGVPFEHLRFLAKRGNVLRLHFLDDAQPGTRQRHFHEPLKIHNQTKGARSDSLYLLCRNKYSPILCENPFGIRLPVSELNNTIYILYIHTSIYKLFIYIYILVLKSNHTSTWGCTLPPGWGRHRREA